MDLKKQHFFEGNEQYTVTISCNQDLDTHNHVTRVKVFTPNTNKEKVTNIIGTDLTVDLRYITIPDIVASLSYRLNLTEGVGEIDDTDHLANKRVRCVGDSLFRKNSVLVLPRGNGPFMIAGLRTI